MCRRILIVEKNHSLADSLALLVERLGHEVRIARDGALSSRSDLIRSSRVGYRRMPDCDRLGQRIGLHADPHH